MRRIVCLSLAFLFISVPGLSADFITVDPSKLAIEPIGCTGKGIAPCNADPGVGSSSIPADPPSNSGQWTEPDFAGRTLLLFDDDGVSLSLIHPNRNSRLADAPGLAQFLQNTGLDLSGAPTDWKLSLAHDTGQGPIILRIQRIFNGSPVIGQHFNIVMNRAGGVTAVTGGFDHMAEIPESEDAGLQLAKSAYVKSPEDVIPALIADVTGGRQQPQGETDSAQQWRAPAMIKNSPSRPIETRSVIWSDKGRLVDAYRIDIPPMVDVDGRPVAATYYVDTDGAILGKINNIHHYEPFHYRIYGDANGYPYDDPYGRILPHPSGMPTGYKPTTPALQSLVEVSELSNRHNDPWLPDGATETVGNNVDAFFNSLITPEGTLGDYDSPQDGPDYRPQDGDFRAKVTAPGVFDYVYNVAHAPDDYFQDPLDPDPAPVDPVPTDSPQLNAKIVHAFYVNNWLHDLFYDVGFDEAAGNAQADNFGRGGLDGDPMLVHAGYYSTFIYTPEDGISPNMRLGLNRYSTSRRGASFDLAVIGHEWTHYMVRRLVAAGIYMGNIQGAGLNEGWSDFIGHFLTVEASDGLPAGAKAWDGTYAVGVYYNRDYELDYYDGVGAPEDSYYYGIRRYPLSVDMTRNPLTFRHIEHGVALPAGLPFFDWKGRSLFNAEYHSAGEVWAVTLWEAYHDLLEQRSDLPFAEKRRRMAEYLVAGMKATPENPTFLEARDALLAVVRASDLSDYRIVQRAFARRGMGAGARAPARDASDNAGVQESFHQGEAALTVTNIQVTDRGYGRDGDGIWDNGELPLVKMTARNTGFRKVEDAKFYVQLEFDEGHFLTQGPFDFPAIQPGQRAHFALPIAGTIDKAGVHEARQIRIMISHYSGPTYPQHIFRDRTFVNYDIKRNSRSDRLNFEETFAAWETARELGEYGSLLADVKWERGELDGTPVYRAMSRNAGFRGYLISPPLKVSANRDFEILLKHAWDFRDPRYEVRGNGFVEISTDGGESWYILDVANMEFTEVSPEYPAMTRTNLNLGLAYAGQTVLIRFQANLYYMATPHDAIETGWAIGGIEFRGIDNRPLLAVVPHPNDGYSPWW
ncbi:M36 family metallopeptidase [Microbulbifer rhizosphaerae]|uniref:Fungalysin metallopeptidase (M36) n=1 Tax=Microbulbifer rhizosphaerae TaxID=1562603 RepID=A0A7W4WDM2_9GAMM|nr:M36 family metallopeptidase [Microbulbifer rhizosphaerae]MBB3061763.1 hypothetical protein [Microbulbifer rhizosphaerae]